MKAGLAFAQIEERTTRPENPLWPSPVSYLFRMSPTYVIRGGTLIDGTGKQPVMNGAVVIRDSKIVSAGRSNEVEHPGDVRTIDVSGRTIMPGLIDAHCHVSVPPYADVREAMLGTIESLTVQAVRNVKKYLWSGFTSIRDCGCFGNISLVLRDAIDAGQIEGPRMKVARRFLCPTGGGADYLAGEGEHTLSMRADGPEGVLEAVRADIAAGVDFIKMEGSGSSDSPITTRESSKPSYIQTYSPEEMVAGVAEAHRRGKRVAFHAEGGEGLRAAIKAGADSIEHGFFLDKEAVNLMRERKVFLVPTIGLLATRMEDEWRSIIPRWILQPSEVAFEGMKESLPLAREAGVKIALGSDCGSMHYPHATGARELEWLVTFAGLTPMEAIQSATSVASQAIGTADMVGTLEMGKLADLLVVRGDPLQNPRVLQDPDSISVIKNGEFVKGWS